MKKWFLGKLIKPLEEKKQEGIDRQQKKLSSLIKKMGVSEHESAMMEGLLNCRNTSVRDIMVPRIDVTALELSLNKKEVIEQIATSIHSRFPVYRENIDNIVGIVHLRDIFLVITKNKRQFNLQPLLNEPFFVPEARLILDVLRDLQKRHLQLAIVIDEYGGFSGIISMEDILEEIIGDVQDEWDDEAVPIINVSPNKYIVSARLSLKEANEKFKTSISDENADTLGGFVVNLFGRVPRVGESINHQGMIYKIKSKKGNSIISIHLQRKK